MVSKKFWNGPQQKSSEIWMSGWGLFWLGLATTQAMFQAIARASPGHDADATQEVTTAANHYRVQGWDPCGKKINFLMPA